VTHHHSLESQEKQWEDTPTVWLSKELCRFLSFLCLFHMSSLDSHSQPEIVHSLKRPNCRGRSWLYLPTLNTQKMGQNRFTSGSNPWDCGFWVKERHNEYCDAQSTLPTGRKETPNRPMWVKENQKLGEIKEA
jgi:hypothetical protein